MTCGYFSDATNADAEFVDTAMLFDFTGKPMLGEFWGCSLDRFVTVNDASPVVVGRRVYAPSMDGFLYVLGLDDGKELQKLQLGQSITASPAAAEGRLILGTIDGMLYCLGSKK